MTTTELTKLSYTLQELSVATGMSVNAIRNEITAGNLVPSYPNRKPLVPRDEAQRWIDSWPTERRAS